jgi:CRISPR-associated protein Cmr5
MDRARSAWNHVHDDIRPKGESVYKEYGSRARDLTELIHTDGLGQTLAFLLAKSKENGGYALLFQHISRWVVGQLPSAAGDTRDLLQRLMDGDSTYYRRATVETLAYVAWLKKFVEAEFGDELPVDAP